MTDEHIRSEDLAEIAALPADDPRRQRLERTPSGRTRLAAYRSFLDPGEVPAGARPDEADARLAERLAAELGRAPTRDRRARAPGDWAAILRSLLAPAWRPAYALAAVAVVVGAVWLVLPRPAERAPRMRGTVVDGNGTSAPDLLARDPRALPGGALELSWTPIAGADRYEVTFLRTDLSALGVARVVHEPRLVLERDALSGAGAHGTTVFWQVAARHGADVLAASRTRPLRVP